MICRWSGLVRPGYKGAAISLRHQRHLPSNANTSHRLHEDRTRRRAGFLGTYGREGERSDLEGDDERTASSASAAADAASAASSSTSSHRMAEEEGSAASYAAHSSVNGDAVLPDQPTKDPSADKPLVDPGWFKRWLEPPPYVPWGVGKIVQVMILWLLAYIIIGQVAVPLALSALGLDRDDLTVRGQAILHLCLDLAQLGVTVGILQTSLRSFRPVSLGLFPIRWRGRWPLLVLACCSLFPLVDWLAQQSVVWFPSEADQWSSQMETSLSIGDWITNGAYFTVVSICAPLWEEVIFRGFLLASLTRLMPVGAAVVASSLIFAMCHFRLQTFLPLVTLGGVFSFVFLATRNLLPPIFLHSLWNIFVLSNLLR